MKRLLQSLSKKIHKGDVITINSEGFIVGVSQVIDMHSDGYLSIKHISGNHYLHNGTGMAKKRWKTFVKEWDILMDRWNDKLKWFTTNGNKK